jgi:glutathione synthase/RimK-type ligase-like ATP-grasp enzyme
MAVNCVLEGEQGDDVERLSDPEGVLNSLIPSMEEATFQCWRFIDLYGDTVFNTLQMSQFLSELKVIRARCSSAQAARILDELERLGHRCLDEVHLYLKFYGD